MKTKKLKPKKKRIIHKWEEIPIVNEPWEEIPLVNEPVVINMKYILKSDYSV